MNQGPAPDPLVRRAVARALYRLLPALYRAHDLGAGALRDNPAVAHDAPENVLRRYLQELRELPEDVIPAAAPPLPRGVAELYRFLEVLAAPLALVHQNIDELHADLFVDRCADEMLPLLAAQVGLRPVFHDPADLRADVRGAVGWRRRKGSVATLRDLASTLLRQGVAVQEGWRRVQVTQGVNALRPERLLPRVRAPSLAATAAGAYDDVARLVDARRPSARGGRAHPGRVAVLAHATRFFQMRQSTPTPWPAPAPGDPALPDDRYIVHPSGAQLPLRVVPASDRPSDRIPLALFEVDPGRFFDDTGEADGRFCVRALGLPAAVAGPKPRAPRVPSARLVTGAFCAHKVDVALLRRDDGPWRSVVDVEVCRVPLSGDAPLFASAEPLGGVRLLATEVSSLSVTSPVGTGEAVAMIRLRAPGATAARFAGAVIELVSHDAAATRAAEDPALASAGFLRGAMIVAVPAAWVWGERWCYLARDGSLYDAQRPTGVTTHEPIPVRREAGAPFALGPLRAEGEGPAWPPAALSADATPFVSVPPPAGQGPVIVHGGATLDADDAPRASAVAGLVFAAREGGEHVPFLRVSWPGVRASEATSWEPLAPDGTPLAAAEDAHARWRSLSAAPPDAVVVRFETDAEDVTLAPCELALTGADGVTRLVCLPELRSVPRPTSDLWATPGATHVSPAVTLHRDGSTRRLLDGAVARHACGPVIPIPTRATLQRRLVRARRLCPWRHEAPLHRLPATPQGHLGVDPDHGLFALSWLDGVPGWPSSVFAWPAPAVLTVDWQDGYSDHVGARAEAREPSLGLAPTTPTRVVTAAGRYRQATSAAHRAATRHATLGDALATIAALPHEARLGRDELIEVEGDATYPEGTLAWPEALRSLTVRGEEGRRPLLRAEAIVGGGVPYERFTARGLAIEVLAGTLSLPMGRLTEVQHCTGLLRWYTTLGPEGTVRVTRSLIGSVWLGDAALRADRTVFDAETGAAIEAPNARVALDRCTVAAREGAGAAHVGVFARTLEASGVIFTRPVQVTDRFSGELRHARLEPGGVAPRRVRVTEAELALVSRNPHDPGHMRLREDSAAEVLRGAEDGGELGAFHDIGAARRFEGTAIRLAEATPAGLVTTLARLD